jgi:hypothetical protein
MSRLFSILFTAILMGSSVLLAQGTTAPPAAQNSAPAPTVLTNYNPYSRDQDCSGIKKEYGDALGKLNSGCRSVFPSIRIRGESDLEECIEDTLRTSDPALMANPNS